MTEYFCPNMILPRQRAAGGGRQMHGDDAAGWMVEGARDDGADAAAAAFELDEVVARRAEIDLPYDPAARSVERAGRRLAGEQFDVVQADRDGGLATRRRCSLAAAQT